MAYSRGPVPELSAENGCQMFIPIGFTVSATLETDCGSHANARILTCARCDAGIPLERPEAVAIDWPIPAGVSPDSAKDNTAATCDIRQPVCYDGRPLRALSP